MSELADVCFYLCEAESLTLCLLIGEITRILSQRGIRPGEATEIKAEFQNNGVKGQ